MKKAIAYFQSGGPSPVINSSLWGAYSSCLKHPEAFSKFLGSHFGVEGLLNDDLFDLSQEDPEEMAYLTQTPASFLGSSRKKMPEDPHDPVYDSIEATLRKYEIGYLLVNGGNDSMDTCDRLGKVFASRGYPLQVLGIPKTVDNDLLENDFSLGYPSCARHMMDAASHLALDMPVYTKGKVVIYEAMGRHAGWVAAAPMVLPKELRPDLCYLPESPWDEGKFLQEVKEVYEQKKCCLLVLSEGVPLEKRNHAGTDTFGHQNQEGVAMTAAELVSEKLGLPTRAVQEATLQRSDASSITLVDQKEAIRAGEFAVESFLKGESGKMVCLKRISSYPYKAELFLAPVENIANGEQHLPSSWIKDSHGMSQEFFDYLLPLVGETIEVKKENGNLRLPKLKFIKA